LEFFNKVENKFNRNSIDGSKKNISYHYDISNDFYQLMLDPTMSYSCAFFTKKEQNLHTAQLNKLELVCNDLNLDESVHCLEIGCGWGGLAVYAVEKYNCRWTGVTISKEQYDFATRLVKEKGLEDKITILLKDYRHIEGQYDRIVSIEMIEAVGDEFLPQYFAKIDSLLKPEGAAVIQAITSPDSRYESFKKGVDFIQKHIFPGTLLPSINAMVSACQKDTQLHLYNLRDIGVHYARTLKVWREKVFDQIEDISKLGLDETFIRKWDYYLSYCEAAFAERHISDVQIVLVKPNNTRFQYSKDLFDY
jgi:cyclopropane-fatty-acyl-phospholipid synthase